MLSTRLPSFIVWILKRIDVFDNSDNLSKIKCLCLLIHGRNDRVLPFEHATKMANILENTNSKTHKIWLDIGHEWRGMIESQPKLRQAVHDFFENVKFMVKL